MVCWNLRLWSLLRKLLWLTLLAIDRWRRLLSALLVSWCEVACGFWSRLIVDKLVVSRCASYTCLAYGKICGVIWGDAEKKIGNCRFIRYAAHVSNIQGPIEVHLRSTALNSLGRFRREKLPIFVRSELQGDQVDVFIAFGLQLFAIVKIIFRGFRNGLRRLWHGISLGGALRFGWPWPFDH